MDIRRFKSDWAWQDWIESLVARQASPDGCSVAHNIYVEKPGYLARVAYGHEKYGYAQFRATWRWCTKTGVQPEVFPFPEKDHDTDMSFSRGYELVLPNDGLVFSGCSEFSVRSYQVVIATSDPIEAMALRIACYRDWDGFAGDPAKSLRTEDGRTKIEDYYREVFRL